MDQIPYLPKEQQDAILAMPALEPPPGVTPNFENPPNQNGLAHGVMATCLTVTTFCLMLRTYLAVASKKVKATEVLILCAFGCYIGWAYCCYRILDHIGYFVHQWDLIIGDLIDLLYYVSIGGVLYSVTLPLLKVAILLEWSQVFVAGGERNAFWWTCYALMALQILFGIAATVALNLVCIPYEAIYDFTVAGQCFDKHNLEVASSIIHLSTDVIMVFLPQRVIWGLQMSLKKKLGVSVVFGLGLLACVSAAFRVQVTFAYAGAADSTYTLAPVVFWAYAEMTCGFVISCMPAAPRLLKETGILRKIKTLLRMHVTTVQASNVTGGSTIDTFSKPSTTTDKYRKIDDDGLLLDDIAAGKSESTERLQQQSSAGKLNSSHSVVRTTQVTVQREYVDDATGNGKYGSPTTAWEAGTRGGTTQYYGRA
ncbi:hypothetical protein MMYC01_204045 [Madurella mycetomatis]|uniref:Rhodopsin domain-containing protein n=1 Tax=Madurella mycetomatis TaxID=100816 RepID=A0A175W6P1_9PEZI|nr:hypothetical protein MMYC01_204045 [Madurella mycetomatis]